MHGGVWAPTQIVSVVLRYRLTITSGAALSSPLPANTSPQHPSNTGSGSRGITYGAIGAILVAFAPS